MTLPAVEMLDRMLAKDGQDVELQRIAPSAGGVTVSASVTVRAFPSGWTEQELATGISQNDSKLILSPTQIIAAGWTSGRVAPEDVRVPRKGNRVVVNGRIRQVEAAVGKYVNNELVRIEIRAIG